MINRKKVKVLSGSRRNLAINRGALGEIAPSHIYRGDFSKIIKKIKNFTKKAKKGSSLVFKNIEK